MTKFKEKLSSIMEEYLNSCHEQNKYTLLHKRRIIIDFIAYLPEGADCINYTAIISWQKTKNVARNTLNGHLCVLKQFLNLVAAHGIQCSEPVIGKYENTYTPYIFSENELVKLIGVADNNISKSRKASSKTICFPIIIRLLAFTGMRLMEVLPLKKEDYDTEAGVFTLTKTKGNKERIVPLHPTLSLQMNKYLNRINTLYPKSIYLFPQDNSLCHITKGQAEYEFNKILGQAGIRKKNESSKKFERSVCIHCLRHYFAINSFRNLSNRNISNGIEHLSVYLGHTSILETETYLKFSHDMYPEALAMFEEYTSDIFKGFEQYE